MVAVGVSVRVSTGVGISVGVLVEVSTVAELFVTIGTEVPLAIIAIGVAAAAMVKTFDGVKQQE